MELAKLPAPDPSDVLLFAMVGLGEVLQQTPLAVIVAPPDEVIFPPELAELDEIEVIELVDTVAVIAAVVIICSVP